MPKRVNALATDDVDRSGHDCATCVSSEIGTSSKYASARRTSRKSFAVSAASSRAATVNVSPERRTKEPRRISSSALMWRSATGCALPGVAGDGGRRTTCPAIHWSSAASWSGSIMSQMRRRGQRMSDSGGQGPMEASMEVVSHCSATRLRSSGALAAAQLTYDTSASRNAVPMLALRRSRTAPLLMVAKSAWFSASAESAPSASAAAGSASVVSAMRSSSMPRAPPARATGWQGMPPKTLLTASEPPVL